MMVRTVLRLFRRNSKPPQNDNLNQKSKKNNLDSTKIIDADFEEIK
jgi:hypothetical protein